MNGRILAVDPGEKHIGLALSDPTGTLASPLTVLPHRSRSLDAAEIARLADENNAVTIIVGQSLDEDGELKPMGRHAARLAEEIRRHTNLQVLMWDEYGSTQKARKTRVEMGVNRSKRGGHLDDLAAAIFLQTFLDDNQNRMNQ